MVSHFPLPHDFVFLRDAMHQLLEDSVIPSGGARYSPSSTARQLPLDVYATPDHVVILAAVPGMNPQDLELTYNQNTVTLSGLMPSAVESEESQDATWYLRELWQGQFRRSVMLPFEVDAGQAEAIFEHGIVRIVLPKAESIKPQRIAIQARNEPREAIAAGS